MAISFDTRYVASRPSIQNRGQAVLDTGDIGRAQATDRVPSQAAPWKTFSTASGTAMGTKESLE